MLGETNGFEGILVADLFYVVTLADTVRRYVTIMTKDSRFEKASQESSSKVALTLTRRRTAVCTV